MAKSSITNALTTTNSINNNNDNANKNKNREIRYFYKSGNKRKNDHEKEMVTITIWKEITVNYETHICINCIHSFSNIDVQIRLKILECK